MTALTNAKLERLLELESGVKERLDQAGVMLTEIRDRGLWEAAGFKNWDDYCRRRWGWTPEHVRRQIRAAEYREELPPPPRGGDKTDVQWSEKTVRELTRLKSKKDAARVAQKAIDRARDQGAEVTAGFVRKVVDEELGVKRGPLPRPEPEPEPEPRSRTKGQDRPTPGLEVTWGTTPAAEVVVGDVLDCFVWGRKKRDRSRRSPVPRFRVTGITRRENTVAFTDGDRTVVVASDATIKVVRGRKSTCPPEVSLQRPKKVKEKVKEKQTKAKGSRLPAPYTTYNPEDRTKGQRLAVFLRDARILDAASGPFPVAEVVEGDEICCVVAFEGERSGRGGTYGGPDPSGRGLRLSPV
jgi:hypothetical protein